MTPHPYIFIFGTYHIVAKKLKIYKFIVSVGIKIKIKINININTMVSDKVDKEWKEQAAKMTCHELADELSGFACLGLKDPSTIGFYSIAAISPYSMAEPSYTHQASIWYDEFMKKCKKHENEK